MMESENKKKEDVAAAVQVLMGMVDEKLVGELTDGYHSYNELYKFRMLYNAGFFNLLARIPNNPFEVHRSRLHNDGEEIFDGKWFIVSAKLPSGIISNHYHIDDWDFFDCPVYLKSNFKYDGHTSKDVMNRLTDFIKSNFHWSLI